MMHYCTEAVTEDGVLLYNLLTKELLLLTEEEYEKRTENSYLKDHWFVVPEGTNEKELADLVKWVLKNKHKKHPPITGYTIFPTTDCNARCFYCFELGRSRIPMREETAHKVADYIAAHCGGEKVSISWFGGEPLYNKAVIDIICNDLREKGVVYTSRAISNGYLFDRETVKNAMENWNLKWVQITLDGTEGVYNKVKAFIYKNTNPYHTVLENIGHLLDAGVTVTIRLNMDMHNADNLLELVEELGQRFAGKKGLHVYAHHLFKGNEPMAEIHTQEEWAERDRAMCRLNEKIRELGLAAQRGITKKPKLNYCMADSGSAVTILPGGEIGLCEHYSEDEFIGHIDKEGFDQAVVNSWKERIPEVPECAECFYYPDCVTLKKCASGSVCFPLQREEYLRKTKREMLTEYERWKKQEQTEETEDAQLC
ncbi:MAG: 4Fe-4S cluster-binding domain-containing protein [Oscillospiraceae bacterium]|nr:4Fe-4S cluster-binding domain-containing protein [Oscillospiraceae bacterium]